jgi:predicted acylesterase/phospholipase RssA/CRP-like cAMP-binding protein
MSALGTDEPAIVGRLRTMPLFSHVGDAALEQVAGAVESVQLPGGATLMREGDEGDAVYMLVSGRLRAFVRRSDTMVSVGDVAAGEIVGEMALLSDQPRSATVQAVRDSHLLKLDRADFVSVVERHPTIVLEAARVIVGRLSRAIHGARPAAAARSIAVVPAGAGSDIGAFTRLLAAQLERLVDVEVLDSTRRDERFGAADPSHADMTQWLHSLEESHSVVLYQSDDEPTEWTRRCLRQADRVLLVADHGGSSARNEIEHELARVASSVTAVEQSLVIVHEPNLNVPSGTSRWLAERSTASPRHVRRNDADDFARLARGLTGRSPAIVLSGGGARGIAHVGVLRALEEHGIPIDAVGSASFGSIVGGFYAMGMNWKDLRDAIQRYLVDHGSVIDLTAPSASLTRGGKIGAELREGFGEVAIEDLWRPFFCTSSNLSAGRVEVHTRGRLRDAIRASISIPGVFPPMRSPAGDVLVDGGIMNNLPVDVMHRMGDGGPIVAVNLRGTIEMASAGLPADGALSGWRTLGSRLNPFRPSPEVPGIVELLLRTTETGAALSASVLEQAATVVLHPPVSDFPLLDFAKIDDLIDAGYRYTTDEIASWSEDEMTTLMGRP